MKHPGRVITTDVIASLVGEAWPNSITPLNIMSGFRKCGIYPLNPGVISDRQLAPSKAVKPALPSLTRSTSEGTLSSVSNSTFGSSPQLFSHEQELLYAKRFEEHYDVYDPSYETWLKINHPKAASN